MLRVSEVEWRMENRLKIRENRSRLCEMKGPSSSLPAFDNNQVSPPHCLHKRQSHIAPRQAESVE